MKQTFTRPDWPQTHGLRSVVRLFSIPFWNSRMQQNLE